MKKFQINLAMIAFVLGAGIALSQSVFTSVRHVNAKQTGTEYQFNGSNSAQEKIAADYSVVSGSGPSCSGTALVCTINVTGDLQTWLNDHTTKEIHDAADQTRN